MENQATAKIVQQHIGRNPFLVEYLRRDLVNIASLARELLPLVQKENKKATLESVAIAIHRFESPKSHISEQLRNIVANVQITMRTDVSLFCLRKGSKLPESSQFDNDDVFFMNQGATEVTIILDEKNESVVRGKPLLHRKKLALISLKDTLITKNENYRVTPGFVNFFLSSVSREGINVEDIISSYSQVTLVVEEKYLEAAYKVCKDVKNLKHL